MFDKYESEDEATAKRQVLRSRIKTIIIGAVAAVVAGLLLVSSYTYFQYGGTPFDSLLGRKEKKSPDIGKLAYDKTNAFLGVIKGEGYSSRLGKVYYIEQAGGQMIQRAKSDIDVRDR